MPRNSDQLENARVKYQEVLALKNSEGEIQWNRYNAMLVVNTVIIGFISFQYSNNFTFPPFFKLIFTLPFYRAIAVSDVV